MRIFSANQVTQVYVATRLRTSTDLPVQEGDIKIGSTPDGELYLRHFGAGGLTRSDLINIKNIMSMKTTVAAAMATTLKKYEVTVKDAAKSSGNMVAGQDYILRLAFNGYIGMSPEDSQYWKYGVVHSTASMSPSDFYKAMALSVAKNMAREAVQFIKVQLKTASDPVDVTATTSADSLNGSYTGIIISEVEPDWILGTKQQKPITVEVIPTEIQVLNANNTYDDVVWGTVTASNGLVIKNGKKTADFEYFHMGERGDQYRMVGFPDYVPTKYLVDPTKEYDYINIHYAYVGSNESVQKSEKDVVILVPRAGTDSTASNPGALTASIVSAITAITNAADSRYVQVPATFVNGELAEFTSAGQLASSGKKASDIS